jgi:hypothetical protein
MGFITDAETGRRRKVHALILTAVFPGTCSCT